ncbi:MAG: PIG-L family deacetylase [Anaerolineae bacterium]
MTLSWPAARHIYLSPHLDDAVLSCGGLIYRQAAAGETVVVITVFAASPPPDHALSPFAARLHARWAASLQAEGAALTDPPAVRRAEDLAAFQALHPAVQVRHHTLPDCIYRTHPAEGWPLYASETAIFGEVHPNDPALDELALAPPLPPDARLYVPLGVGHHVDHQIVRRSADGWGIPAAQIAYYEEYPYAASPGAVQAVITQDPGLRPLVIALDQAAIRARLRAIARHTSQINTFWHSIPAMEQTITRYINAVGGERLWVRQPING